MMASAAIFKRWSEEEVISLNEFFNVQCNILTGDMYFVSFLSTRAERRGKNWGNRGAKLTWKVPS